MYFKFLRYFTETVDVSLKEKHLTRNGAVVHGTTTHTHLIRINETRRLMAFLDGRLVSFCDGNLLAKLMMSTYNEWLRNERVN